MTPRKTIVCDSCDDKTPFVVSSNNQKRHTKEDCQRVNNSRWKKKHYKRRPMPMVVCDACEDKTPFRSSARHQKRHNTNKCKAIHQNKMYKPKNRPLPMIVCDSCDDKTPFQATSWRQKRHKRKACIDAHRIANYTYSKRLIICESCGLPLKATAPNQKIHPFRDGDCFKMRKKLYNIGRSGVISGRHRRSDLTAYEHDVDKVYFLDLTGECKYRACLKCGKDFKSTSKGHRVCHNCANSNKHYFYDPRSVNLRGNSYD